MGETVSPAAVDIKAVETAEIDAAGGPDFIDVGHLGGTGLDRLRAGLGAADGARDRVSVQGTSVHDSVSVSAAGAVARIFGVGAVL